MKGLEQFTDLLAMAIGVTGALLKGLKKRLKVQALVSAMIIAGILSYSLIGVIEIFYDELTPRLIILVSFVVGWIANEVTEKIDLVFEDLYEYFLGWLKSKTKKNK
jgi:CHASE2 domain-containing sensor protein